VGTTLSLPLPNPSPRLRATSTPCEEHPASHRLCPTFHTVPSICHYIFFASKLSATLMRSRRSSRDSIPSTTVEDGDDSEQQPLVDAEDECQFSTAHKSHRTGESAKKSLPQSATNEGVWSATIGELSAKIPLSLDSTPSTTASPLEPSLDKENMEDIRNRKRPRPRLRSNWACSAGTFSVTLLAAFVLWSIIQSYNKRQCDAKGCRMSRMSPYYLKAKDFDTEHTRFASKYNLYLYRESGVDVDYPVRFPASPNHNVCVYTLKIDIFTMTERRIFRRPF
jgi:hypothetical protein